MTIYNDYLVMAEIQHFRFFNMSSNLVCIGQLVERQRFRLRSGRFKVQISGQSNQTQRCQRLTTVVALIREVGGVLLRRNNAEMQTRCEFNVSVTDALYIRPMIGFLLISSHKPNPMMYHGINRN